MDHLREQTIAAISGVKNSGKTTCITRILPILSAAKLRVAVIKHDGHDFEPDVPGTDSWKIRQAGAYGTAVFSRERWMIVKREETTECELFSAFPEADIILLEGFKYSKYPKIELIRSGNSDVSVCEKETLLAIATDIEDRERFPKGIPIVSINDAAAIADVILRYHAIKNRSNAEDKNETD